MNSQRVREMSVRTNSFAITTLPPMDYFQYKDFIPPVKQLAKRLRLFDFFQVQVAPDIFPFRAIYDGESLVHCPKRLKLPVGGSGIYSLDFKILSNPSRNSGSQSDSQNKEIVQQRIKIEITNSEVIRPSRDVQDLILKGHSSEKALVATNLMQLIVRQRPNMQCKNARAYFPDIKKQIPLGNGELEIRRGFFQSVRPSLGKMILTIDTCIAVIYAGGPLINMCLAFVKTNNIRYLNYNRNDIMFRKLEGFLDGVRITYQNGRGKSHVKTICGLVPNAGEYSFEVDDRNETITVKDYFKSIHGIHIRYPSIIGVRITRKSAPKACVVPLELCTVIPGQFFKKRLDEELTPKLLEIATLSPADKLRKVTEAALAYKDCEYVIQSQMSVNTNPLEVRGRLLHAPEITYGGHNRPFAPQLGAWNSVSKTLYVPQQLTKWAVVNFCPVKLPDPQCQKYIEQLRQCCEKLGMKPTLPDAVVLRDPAAVEQALDDTVCRARHKTKGETPQLLLVILPPQAAGIKKQVKYWGDIKHGILTQCIRVDKFTNPKNRSNDQYWNNVALKLNARLKGVNWHTNSVPIMTEVTSKPFMIMGADVSHPAPKMQHPSTASVVYSSDRTATTFAALTRLQPPRVECILDLKEMVTSALTTFKKKHGYYPVQLFFYRDGISDAEINSVAKRVEINDIRAALQELGQEKPVKLTYMVVTKRHHTVFFPTSSQTADRNGNCLPGTVVDKDITHPAMHDFYLQSHASIKGTSRSSHYIVVCDDNFNFNMEKLQNLSYALCHVYAKATRAVSIPAPVYYAHLVSSRGMIHLDPQATGLNFSEPEFDSKSTSSGGSKKDKKPVFELQPWLDAFRGVNGGLSERMYFL